MLSLAVHCTDLEPMSLSAHEYREHLQATADRNGFVFDPIVLPEEADVRVGALSLHYLDWGTEGRPPILFLHGGGLTAHTWDMCCLALREDFHCVALDQRGHGDSDWPPELDYSIGSQREDIKGFVDGLGWDRFALVGMSMGGLNALGFAETYPERLSALVMVDIGPDPRLPGSRRIRDFVNDVAEIGSLDAIIDRALSFNPRRDREMLRRSLMHNLRQQPDGNWAWKYDRRRYGYMDRDSYKAERRGLADGLARVTCPALIVRGAQSDVFHAEDAESLAERLPRGQLVTIARAGHTVQGDNPKDLTAELRRFLGGAG